MDGVLRAGKSGVQKASHGLTQAYTKAAHVANKTRLDLRQLYLQRQTKMAVDFVPAPTVRLIREHQNQSALVWDIIASLEFLQRYHTQTSVLSAHLSKSYTALAVSLAQSPALTPSQSHQGVSSLGNFFEGARGLSQGHAKSIDAAHRQLVAFVSDTASEIDALISEFDAIVQKVHVAKMEAQLVQEQSQPNPDDVRRVEWEEKMATEAFQTAVANVDKRITAFLVEQDKVVGAAVAVLHAAEGTHLAGRYHLAKRVGISPLDMDTDPGVPAFENLAEELLQELEPVPVDDHGEGGGKGGAGGEGGASGEGGGEGEGAGEQQQQQEEQQVKADGDAAKGE